MVLAQNTQGKKSTKSSEEMKEEVEKKDADGDLYINDDLV